MDKQEMVKDMLCYARDNGYPECLDNADDFTTFDTLMLEISNGPLSI